ncbi:adenylate/guanylate cyclase domain-containing protein [Flagellimonas sp. 2504JD4-2]
MVAPIIPENEEQRLTELLSLNLSSVDVKKQFDGVVTVLSKCLEVPIAYISTIESKNQIIHSSCGLDFNSSDRSTSFCGHTILQSTPLIIEDTLEDERFFDNPMVINDPKIRFYAGYPLSSQEGFNVGALCIADYVPRKLNKTEIKILKIIGKLLNERIWLNNISGLQGRIADSRRQLEKLNLELSESNQFYQNIFGQYMSQSLLEKVISNKRETKLGGEERNVTVLISDLRGFSNLSKNYKPNIVLEILNIYFEEMIEIIHNHEGYINEILGDGILVVFGAPRHVGNCALKAVKCAKLMQKGLKRVNKKLQVMGYPNLEMGIGINSGNLIVGNIGSKKRMKYGVVGETINIASRIEALTISGQILVSENTYKKLGDKTKTLGRMRTKVKGAEDPIVIYDLSELSGNQ